MFMDNGFDPEDKKKAEKPKDQKLEAELEALWLHIKHLEEQVRRLTGRLGLS